jgi:hypothetical protein
LFTERSKVELTIAHQDGLSAPKQQMLFSTN